MRCLHAARNGQVAPRPAASTPNFMVRALRMLVRGQLGERVRGEG